MARRVNEIVDVFLSVLRLETSLVVCSLMVMPRSRSRSILSKNCSFMSRSATSPVFFDQAVGKRRFAMVDMGDNLKFLIYFW